MRNGPGYNVSEKAVISYTENPSMNARYRVIAGVAAVYIFACTATTRTLSWEDTSQNEEGFRIYRVVGKERKIIAEVGPNVTRYVDRNAPPNACYVVTAFNAVGESAPSNPVCGTGSPPTALSRTGN